MRARTFAALLVAAASANCTVPMNEGRPFNTSYADQIVIGKTTKAEVTANLGEPQDKTIDRDERVWIYRNMAGFAGTTLLADYAQASRQVLAIGFKGDVVSDCILKVENAGGAGFAGSGLQSTSDTRRCGIRRAVR
jgi:outer membrane protein assembly factor BamE (lipoprotein component of BamABCDE complex)